MTSIFHRAGRPGWTLKYEDATGQDRFRTFRTRALAEDEALRQRGAALAAERAELAGLAARRGGPELFELSAEEVAALYCPIVYAWVRRDTVLYVGMSEQGLRRALDPRHHRLRLEGDDRLRVWPCSSAAAAVSKERALIARWRPQLNRRLR